MIGHKTLAVLAAAALVAALALTPATSGAQTTTSTHYTGTLADGAIWIADDPDTVERRVLLYSHGFGPLVAADSPDPVTQQALLDRGYALAGSSYDPNGSWWALDSALTDQFQMLTTVKALLPRSPRHVIAFGTSMGGLISELEDEHSNGRLDASLTTCGSSPAGSTSTTTSWTASTR